MSTKKIDKIAISKDIVVNEFQNRLDKFFKAKIEPLLSQRWVEMDNNLLYDNKIKACWYGLNGGVQKGYYYYSLNHGIEMILDNIKSRYKLDGLDLPTKKELITSLANLKKAPFILRQKRPNLTSYYLYKKNGKTQAFNIDYNFLCNANNGLALPIFRIGKENGFRLSNIEVFIKWLDLGLIPKTLKKDKTYLDLLKDSKLNIEDNLIDTSVLLDNLLNEDKIRVDIKPYNHKIVDDIEQGLWSLWDEPQSSQDKIILSLSSPLYARDPSSSIIDGTVGIDFGTKSTVVVYQKDNTKIYPMRVGTGDLAQNIASSHYENPTIMEFNKLEKFIESYRDRDGRPYTKWADLTISHTAFNSLLNSKSDDYNSFISELKQWAGDKNRKLKVVDKRGYILDLSPFLDISNDDINPIEIYAYYLGLYINNQHNGIYMNYILSFPVTYEIEIRDKIIESFQKGISKSLPQELHNQPKEMDKLSIIAGASEPAAYAIVALEEYGFAPQDDERVFYGVFDFGGGTTDFDFGIYREAGTKERRFDYVIEHFGAGGDRYLGGENLLELLAFEIFKANRDKLLKENIQFILPPECDEFLGGETLISISREAKLNSKILMEKLRPFWEGVEENIEEFNKGTLEVNLTQIDGTQKVNFELDIDNTKMIEILDSRISKGVDNFFNSLRLAFGNRDIEFEKIQSINIFLAGNSSKSMLLKEIFKDKIAKEEESIKRELNIKESDIFKLFDPLGANDSKLDSPTGKTGVAFGLIKSRKGGKIKVIDHNVKEDIDFKFYLGMEKKSKFRVVIPKDTDYNKWVDFIDACEDTFELYYSTQSIVTTNRVDISDTAIKKRILKTDIVDEDGLVYIRLINPTTLEYVVALEDKIDNQEYLGNIVRIELKV